MVYAKSCPSARAHKVLVTFWKCQPFDLSVNKHRGYLIYGVREDPFFGGEVLLWSWCLGDQKSWVVVVSQGGLCHLPWLVEALAASPALWLGQNLLTRSMSLVELQHGLGIGVQRPIGRRHMAALVLGTIDGHMTMNPLAIFARVCGALGVIWCVAWTYEATDEPLGRDGIPSNGTTVC